MIIDRPKPARWFRLIAAREDLPFAVSVLARHQAIEPEAEPPRSPEDSFAAAETMVPALSPLLAARLENFRAMAERYQPYWPQPVPQPSTPQPVQPLTVLDQALAAIDQWRLPCDPEIVQMQSAIAQRADLEILADLADQRTAGRLDLTRLRQVGSPDSPGCLIARLYVLPLTRELLPSLPSSLLTLSLSGTRQRFLAAIGPPEPMASLTETIATANGRPLDLPEWLHGIPSDNLANIQQRLEQCQAEIHRLRAILEQQAQDHDLPQHLWSVANLQWFFHHITDIAAGSAIALITGWTDSSDQGEINHLLQQSGSRALLAIHGDAPPDPPLILDNPQWAKPFELFPRLLGIPGRYEADPTRILALIAPLIFGYMFGDLGQGLLLALAGLWLAKGHPAGWLFTAGGLSAALFGLVFGSVFCHEDWIPALWLHPMTDPLLVLTAPLFFGIGIILASLAISGVQAHWRGQFLTWRSQKSGGILVYLGLLLTIWHPIGWILAAIGVMLHVGGHCRHAAKPVLCLTHTAELLETLLQLGVNTLSFSRIGAFALAHAGLSMAVISLAELTGNVIGSTMVLVIGNGIILLLEGLVVSVQTTRLILFEFFIRFLTGEGRPFRPLPQPPA